MHLLPVISKFISLNCQNYTLLFIFYKINKIPLFFKIKKNDLSILFLSLFFLVQYPIRISYSVTRFTGENQLADSPIDQLTNLI